MKSVTLFFYFFFLRSFFFDLSWLYVGAFFIYFGFTDYFFACLASQNLLFFFLFVDFSFFKTEIYGNKIKNSQKRLKNTKERFLNTKIHLNVQFGVKLLWELPQSKELETNKRYPEFRVNLFRVWQYSL